jgi:hypothetical protein
MSPAPTLPRSAMNPTTTTAAFPAPLLDAMTVGLPLSFGFLPGLADDTAYAGWESPLDGMTSVIHFTGDLSWSFCLVLPRASVTGIGLAFTGFDFPYGSPYVSDVVGELANVLAGDVSAQAQARGIEARMSLPTVACGSDLRMPVPPGVVAAHRWYHSDPGPFGLRLMLTRPRPTWARPQTGSNSPPA